MKIHRMESALFLPIPAEEAWDFFTRPENLALITPPEMALEITHGGGRTIHDGQIIAYRIRLFPGWRVRWVTEIKHVESEVSFVDEQRGGPYRFWHHRHHFAPVSGGVKMTDTVHYALPMGWLGNVVAGRYVRAEVAKIFAFRTAVLHNRFGVRSSP